MNDIGPEAKSLFEAARKAEGLTGPERARIKQAVLLQAGTMGAAASVTGGAVAVSMATKLTLVAVVLAILGAGSVSLWAWKKHNESAPTWGTSAPSPAFLAVTKPAVNQPPVTEEPAPVPASAPAIDEAQVAKPAVVDERPTAEKPAPAVKPHNRVPVHAASGERRVHALVPMASHGDPAHADSRSTAASPSLTTDTLSPAVDKATGPAPASLDSELNLLRQAQEDLRIGMPAQALNRLADFDRLFPRPKLDQERQAIEAIATCQVHPGPAALGRAQRFLQKAPLSPLAARVRSACQQNDEEASPRRERSR
jgi:hypothetical protein